MSEEALLLLLMALRLEVPFMGTFADVLDIIVADLLLAACCICLLLSVLERLSWLTFCWYSILASATFTPPMEVAAPAAGATADLEDEEDEDPCEEMSLPLESRLQVRKDKLTHDGSYVTKTLVYCSPLGTSTKCM